MQMRENWSFANVRTGYYLTCIRADAGIEETSRSPYPFATGGAADAATARWLAYDDSPSFVIVVTLNRQEQK